MTDHTSYNLETRVRRAEERQWRAEGTSATLRAAMRAAVADLTRALEAAPGQYDPPAPLLAVAHAAIALLTVATPDGQGGYTVPATSIALLETAIGAARTARVLAFDTPAGAAEKCQRCGAPLDNVTTGISVMSNVTQTVTVCANCARLLETAGWVENLRARGG